MDVARCAVEFGFGVWGDVRRVRRGRCLRDIMHACVRASNCFMHATPSEFRWNGAQ